MRTNRQNQSKIPISNKLQKHLLIVILQIKVLIIVRSEATTDSEFRFLRQESAGNAVIL